MKKLLMLLVVITSCGTARYSESNHPKFFACNDWIDDNQDGEWNFSEFRNIKDTFRAYEKIMLIGYFTTPTGAKLKLEIFAPDGSLFEKLEYSQTRPTSIFHYNQWVRVMISKYTTGQWQGKWSIEDNPVALTSFYLEN
jgi:hypothetical protein